ncbi:hypothetical protein FQN55_000895 [Onygenales sp. PD_40]|nr:hypothetical protein FQN55_000895 [Onygenales sp. PD_40]KAK2781988.1 hypothetical protein FQN53_000238 [Emmonsiellopsis sp. PD_33]KAK2803726.1 hypothetical protein FQN51_002955 [Onygenales sp. PD_10]
MSSPQNTTNNNTNNNTNNSNGNNNNNITTATTTTTTTTPRLSLSSPFTPDTSAPLAMSTSSPPPTTSPSSIPDPAAYQLACIYLEQMREILGVDVSSPMPLTLAQVHEAMEQLRVLAQERNGEAQKTKGTGPGQKWGLWKDCAEIWCNKVMRQVDRVALMFRKGDGNGKVNDNGNGNGNGNDEGKDDNNERNVAVDGKGNGNGKGMDSEEKSVHDSDEENLAICNKYRREYVMQYFKGLEDHPDIERVLQSVDRQIGPPCLRNCDGDAGTNANTSMGVPAPAPAAATTSTAATPAEYTIESGLDANVSASSVKTPVDSETAEAIIATNANDDSSSNSDVSKEDADGEYDLVALEDGDDGRPVRSQFASFDLPVEAKPPEGLL